MRSEMWAPGGEGKDRADAAGLGAFVAFGPAALASLGWRGGCPMELYHLAYEQARASLAPSIVEQARMASWN